MQTPNSLGVSEATIILDGKFLPDNRGGIRTGKMIEYARSFDGHLTATIDGTDGDLEKNAALMRMVQPKVGRSTKLNRLA